MFIRNIQVVKFPDPLENELFVTFTGLNIAICNGIRRTIMRDVPSIAFTEAKFKKNTSNMADEYFAHRIMMLRVQNEKLPTKWEDLTFTMHAKCSPDQEFYNITAADIKSSDSRIYVDPNYFIGLLKRGQEIHLTMNLERGTGIDHAKFIPAQNVKYKIIEMVSPKTIGYGTSSVDIDKDELYGTIFEDKKISNDRRNELIDKLQSHRDTKHIAKYGKLEYRYVQIGVCGTGVLSPPHVLQLAIETLITKVQKAKPIHIGDDFRIDNEGDTIGNMLQTEIISRDPNIDFCAYTTSYPIAETRHINIRAPEKAIHNGLKTLENTLKTLLIEAKKIR